MIEKTIQAKTSELYKHFYTTKVRPLDERLFQEFSTFAKKELDLFRAEYPHSDLSTEHYSELRISGGGLRQLLPEGIDPMKQKRLLTYFVYEFASIMRKKDPTPKEKTLQERYQDNSYCQAIVQLLLPESVDKLLITLLLQVTYENEFRNNRNLVFDAQDAKHLAVKLGERKRSVQNASLLDNLQKVCDKLDLTAEQKRVAQFVFDMQPSLKAKKIVNNEAGFISTLKFLPALHYIDQLSLPEWLEIIDDPSLVASIDKSPLTESEKIQLLKEHGVDSDILLAESLLPQHKTRGLGYSLDSLPLEEQETINSELHDKYADIVQEIYTTPLEEDKQNYHKRLATNLQNPTSRKQLFEALEPRKSDANLVLKKRQNNR